MKLFLIDRIDRVDYGEFDGAVVAAPDEETARNMHPRDGQPVAWDEKPYANGLPNWAFTPHNVQVTYIGEAKEGTAAGVVLSSYRAG
jgi:hypothetical protein